MKKILCKFFGHKPKHLSEHKFVNDGEKTAECECKRCGVKMFGYYTKGKLSNEYFWVYITI